jgi:HPt (histidine-containing phosphotransfer) domain-containing protein
MNSLRVLLVESHSEKSEAISNVLANANHTVLRTTGLEEAAEALFVERFDVVLLASSFSPASLQDFIATVRRAEQNQRSSTRIPVLALESLNLCRADAPGCDGYLNEPIDPAALSSAVRNLSLALARPLETRSPATDALAVIDRDKFEEQVGYDNELMVEIIDLFLEERKSQIRDMESCVANGNWESLSRLAHTIKGSLGSLHAARARTRAQELESAARINERDVSAHTFSKLVEDLEVLETQLLVLKDEANSSPV